MKAAVVASLGASPTAGDAPEPVPASGHTLVAVRVAPLNPVDLAITAGNFYAYRPEPPYVPGVEGVGEVVASERFAPGTRVWFECGPKGGALAELVLVEDGAIVPIPDLVDFERAAIGNSALAAWLGLERAAVQPGDTVLVLGATGVVGGIAVQLARRLGAGRVIGAGRDAERLGRLSGFLDATVHLGPDPAAMRDELERAVGGHGFDVVFDLLWGAPATAAAALAAPAARWIQVGNGAGPATELAATTLRARSMRLEGFALFSVPLEAKRDAYAEIARVLVEEGLEIPLEVAPLSEIEVAWARQVGAGGKQLLRM